MVLYSAKKVMIFSLCMLLGSFAFAADPTIKTQNTETLLKAKINSIYSDLNHKITFDVCKNRKSGIVVVRTANFLESCECSLVDFRKDPIHCFDGGPAWVTIKCDRRYDQIISKKVKVLVRDHKTNEDEVFIVDIYRNP